MMPLSKNKLQIALSLVTALIIIVVAYTTKGTEYENSWLYILVVSSIILAAIEIVAKVKDK